MSSKESTYSNINNIDSIITNIKNYHAPNRFSIDLLDVYLDPFYISTIKSGLQKKGFDVSVYNSLLNNESKITIHWGSSMRRFMNIFISKEHMSDYNEIQKITQDSVEEYVNIIKDKCVSNKNYLVLERFENLNIVNASCVTTNKVIYYETIDEIKYHNIHDVEFLEKIIASFKGNYKIVLEKQYISCRTKHQTSARFYRTYRVKYYFRLVPKFFRSKDSIIRDSIIRDTI